MKRKTRRKLENQSKNGFKQILQEGQPTALSKGTRGDEGLPRASGAETQDGIEPLLTVAGNDANQVMQFKGREWSSIPAVRRKELEAELEKLLRGAFGGSDDPVAGHLLHQVCNTVPYGEASSFDTMDLIVNLLYGIGPKDQIETLLAAQMTSTHMLAMEMMRRAVHNEQTEIGVELNINRATKLLRTFSHQTEALARYRGKGQQKMIVEHVNVHSGGQAIIGPVNTNAGDPDK